MGLTKQNRFQTFTLFPLGKDPGKAKNINAVPGQNRETNTQVTGSSPAKTQKCVQLVLLRELRISVLAQAKDALLLLSVPNTPVQARGKGSIKEMAKAHPTDLLAEVSLGLQIREECSTRSHPVLPWTGGSSRSQRGENSSQPLSPGQKQVFIPKLHPSSPALFSCTTLSTKETFL